MTTLRRVCYYDPSPLLLMTFCHMSFSIIMAEVQVEAQCLVSMRKRCRGLRRRCSESHPIGIFAMLVQSTGKFVSITATILVRDPLPVAVQEIVYYPVLQNMSQWRLLLHQGQNTTCRTYFTGTSWSCIQKKPVYMCRGKALQPFFFFPAWSSLPWHQQVAYLIQ
jgi:hypothetical protein